MSIKERQKIIMEKGAERITQWVGSTSSVMLHTLLFLTAFTLPVLGVMSFERMLLFLTTIVSLEAIYLSIFIQMSLNMNNQNIGIIQEDIEELGEEIEELGEEIEEIGEDIEELGEDIEELGEDIEELGEDIEELGEDIEEIQKEVDELQEEDEHEVTPVDAPGKERKNEDILLSIQATLAHLQQEIELLKAKAK